MAGGRFTFHLPALAVFALLQPEMVLAGGGGTFYLAPHGDDGSGDGSRQRPWRTIRHATVTVPDDGSTIVLLDGLYVGLRSINRQYKDHVRWVLNACRFSASDI